MLKVNNVTKQYNGFTAVEGVSLTVPPGMAYGLIGYNGAGKTTLLKTICGVLQPEAGNITLDGQNVFNNSAAKGRIFFVPDVPYWLPQANMKRMAAFYRGFYPKWNGGLYAKLVSLFKLDESKRLAGFSKGMQRQAAIIFAFSAMADYLLLDEIFDGLDLMMKERVYKLLQSAVSGQGMGVIVSSHDITGIAKLCGRVGILNGKRLLYDADVNTLLKNEKMTLEEILLKDLDGQNQDYGRLFKK
jgi:ABC-2 type transport system ATP-binding protein